MAVGVVRPERATIAPEPDAITPDRNNNDAWAENDHTWAENGDAWAESGNTWSASSGGTGRHRASPGTRINDGWVEVAGESARPVASRARSA